MLIIACGVEIRWRTWPLRIYPISLTWEILGLLLQYGLTHYPCALWSTVQSLLQQLAESQQRVITLLLLSAVTSSVNTSNLVLVAAIHARSHASVMFDVHKLFLSFSSLFSSQQAHFGFMCRETDELPGLFDFFLAKSDLAFLLFSVTRGLHLVDASIGLSGLLALLSWPVHSFFLIMYQIVDLATSEDFPTW